MIQKSPSFSFQILRFFIGVEENSAVHSGHNSAYFDFWQSKEVSTNYESAHTVILCNTIKQEKKFSCSKEVFCNKNRHLVSKNLD